MSIIALAPLLALAQTAVDDRVLVRQFEEVANRLAPVFEKATAQKLSAQPKVTDLADVGEYGGVLAPASPPTTTLVGEINQINQDLLVFEQKLLAVRKVRFATGQEAGIKTLSLLQWPRTWP